MIFIQGVDSIESVLSIRRQATESLASGGQVVSWSVEGTSVTKLVGIPIKDVIEECNEFLRLVAPEIFGRRVKRTIPVYIN